MIILPLIASFQATTADYDSLNRRYGEALSRYESCLDEDLGAKPYLKDAQKLAQRAQSRCSSFASRADLILREMNQQGPVESFGSFTLTRRSDYTADEIVRCRLRNLPEKVCNTAGRFVN